MEPIGDNVKIMRRGSPKEKKKKKIDPEMSLHNILVTPPSPDKEP